MEAIITAATVATMFFNVANSSVKNGFNYNATLEGDKIVAVNVYDASSKYLQNKMQYSYSYDENSRLVKKTAQKFNTVTNKWENAYELVYTYSENGYTLSRNNWNAKTQEFENAKQMMAYQMVNKDVMAVSTYKWDDATNDFAQTENILVMSPQQEVLYSLSENIEK